MIARQGGGGRRGAGREATGGDGDSTAGGPGARLLTGFCLSIAELKVSMIIIYKAHFVKKNLLNLNHNSQKLHLYYRGVSNIVLDKAESHFLLIRTN